MACHCPESIDVEDWSARDQREFDGPPSFFEGDLVALRSLPAPVGCVRAMRSGRYHVQFATWCALVPAVDLRMATDDEAEAFIA